MRCRACNKSNVDTIVVVYKYNNILHTGTSILDAIAFCQAYDKELHEEYFKIEVHDVCPRCKKEVLKCRRIVEA